MDRHKTEAVAAAIAYIEEHLDGRLDLSTVASAVYRSKYHLHRMFTDMVGMTLHDYIQCRQLTEAARLLVFSERPIIEIALAAGYESQQAFTSIFKAMYKQTPLRYRRNKSFYPLQLRSALREAPAGPETVSQTVSYAVQDDIPDWMEFVALVIQGFPCLEERAHREQVERYIQRRQALIVRDGPAIVGAAAFSDQAGTIDFLAVDPRYRDHGTAKVLLDFMVCGRFRGREISITTFREGDKADTGQRAEYKRLGFAESELLTEFGYPTQRLVRTPRKEESGDG